MFPPRLRPDRRHRRPPARHGADPDLRLRLRSILDPGGRSRRLVPAYCRLVHVLPRHPRFHLLLGAVAGVQAPHGVRAGAWRNPDRGRLGNRREQPLDHR
ncbi:UNVERIFIED_CONTAM: hypothetical protein GTU68_063369, partial [Idotea baltica]|nr:hypothetical protein [Idotea baltica]